MKHIMDLRVEIGFPGIMKALRSGEIPEGYELQEMDVDMYLGSGLGRVLRADVGKLIKWNRRGGYIMIENAEQRAARKGKKQ